MKQFPGPTCCSMAVVELARRHCWKNFYFEPLDTNKRILRHQTNYRGVDYLGETWPPKDWYPVPPQVGRSTEEWILAYLSDDVEESSAARSAIMCLGKEAIPGLAMELDHPDLNHRMKAAQIIESLNLYERDPVDDSTAERVREVYLESPELFGKAPEKGRGSILDPVLPE
ncbi:hypothetical protein [Kolteria novifilia]